MITVSEHEIISERTRTARIICGIAGSIFLVGGLSGIGVVLIQGRAAVGGGDPRIVMGLMTLGPLIGLRILAEAGFYRLRLDCRTHCYEERSSFLGIERCKAGPFSDFLKLRLDAHDRNGIEGALYLQRRNPRRPAIWLASYRSMGDAKQEMVRISALTGIPDERGDRAHIQKSA